MALTDFAKPSQNGTAADAPHAPAPVVDRQPAAPSIFEAIDGEASAQSPPDHDTADVGGFDGVLDWIEAGMTEAAENATAQKDAPPPPTETPGETVTVSGKSDPLAAQGVEISVEIYVEILEAVANALAGWYSGDDQTDFSFDKKLKARYAKVAELYAKTQNIEVSPGFLFFAFTVVLLGQVGFKAHQKKQQIIKAKAFRQQVIARQATPNRNGQTSLFPLEKPEEKAVFANPDGKTYNIPEAEYSRKDWQIDSDGFYVKDANGSYLKKSERRQKPSPELKAFFDEFYSAHLAYPTNKQTKQFLKTV